MELSSIDHTEIEKRKERVRRAWSYKRVDHLPLGFILEDYRGRTLREACTNGEVQVEANLHAIDRLLRLLPDDYIPAARIWPGYMTIATMFGIAPHWSDDPDQPPGIQRHIIAEVGQLASLPSPDAKTDGLMPFILRWMGHMARILPPDVSIAGPDLGGPMNTAKDLFDTDLLFTALYDYPAELSGFLARAADLQAECYREVIRAAGGVERLTCIDFDPLWAPEDRKGFVSDDVSAGLSPEHFRQFSMPANNRILEHWRGGRIHNCGPHPAAELYLAHTPPLSGLNCSFRFSRADLPRLRAAFKGKGIIECMFDNGETAEQIVAGYREMMEALAPDTIGIPVVWLGPAWSDDDIRALYAELERVARQYAAAIRWTEGDPS